MLPPLPTKKKTKEADITPKILKWFEDNYPFTVAVEIKIDKNKLLPHQETALKQVASGAFSHKLRDTSKNPFDAFVLQDARPIVVRYDTKTKQCTANCLKTGDIFYFSP